MQLAEEFESDDFIPAVERLKRDLLTAAESLTTPQARYLVDAYYALQDFRIQAEGQTRAAAELAEPTLLSIWLGQQFQILESSLRRVLDRYSDQQIVGRWSKSICGIGPVIGAGLLAHIDIMKAPTVGHIWRFAGLDPTQKWDKGAKRPWNAKLKVLCWKIGQSFMKQRSRPNDFYGKLYEQRKMFEVGRNDRGENAAVAAQTLADRRFAKGTETRAAYEGGKLPAGRIELRAERWATKLFLAHWHAVAYRAHWQKDAPKPYVLSILGHADEIQVPNWPW